MSAGKFFHLVIGDFFVKTKLVPYVTSYCYIIWWKNLCCNKHMVLRLILSQVSIYFKQNMQPFLFITHKFIIVFQKNVSFYKNHGIMILKVPDTPLIAMRTTSGRFDFRSFLCKRRKVYQSQYLLMNR